MTNIITIGNDPVASLAANNMYIAVGMPST
jgi:hypothetical protein